MPDEGFPRSIKKTEIAPDTRRRIGVVSGSMTVDQGRYYDVRASIYDRQNELPWRAERLRRFDAYYHEKLQKLLKPGGITYLDFGCSTGSHTKQFIAGLTHNPVQEGYGIDISPKSVELAVLALPEFKFIAGGADKIDFKDKFDLGTSFFHVLGHLSEMELGLFFQNISRSLKPGGILCFDVIKMPLANRIFKRGKRYLSYTVKHPDDPDGSVVEDENGEPLIGSIGTFTKKQIVDLAQKNNLEVVELTTLKGEPSGDLAVILRKKQGNSQDSK